jgi:hypothetical protein
MQTKPTLLALGVALILSATAHAQLTIPSDGSDGAFSPNANVEIDLGLAANGIWNSPGGGNGVYDAEKWAVVFKYSSVNIPTGVKVTFKNHPTYAPVVWLVQGNVTVAGELNLDGKAGTVDSTARLTPSEPGPGGYRGGASGPSGYGAGLGPGGTNTTNFGNNATYSGSYGNPQIIPLMGGSGLAARYTAGQPSGGGGGGAIAIFAANQISLSGTVSAIGGAYQDNYGSGGAVRLVASGVAGVGQVRCVTSGINNPGRIRIETNSLTPTLQTFPETIGVPPANTPVIWPAANAPVAKVISVDAVNAPADPRAPLVAGADVAIQNSNQVAILIQTQNFPIEGVVQLNINPKFGNRTTLNATRLSGDITQAIWRVQTTLPQGFVTLQARATQP